MVYNIILITCRNILPLAREYPLRPAIAWGKFHAINQEYILIFTYYIQLQYKSTLLDFNSFMHNVICFQRHASPVIQPLTTANAKV